MALLFHDDTHSIIDSHLFYCTLLIRAQLGQELSKQFGNNN